MKVRHFFAVCLASVVWSGIANSSLLACEECNSGHVCNACCQSDDRGLLDRIDSALVRRQPHLPRVCLPQLPSLRDTFQDGLLGNCGCGAGPSCGCELSPASCGCEITPASCGVELSGVARRPAAQWQRNSNSPSQPDVPSPEIASDAFQPRQQPVHRPQAATQVMPLQQHMPAETVPAPDNENDPFRDDSARVLRRVPAQSVQLRPSGRAYRQSYDPQARHESVRMSLSDQGLPGQRRNPTSLSQRPGTSLDAHGSSRQGNVAHDVQPSNQRPLPAVVTASGMATSGYAQQPPSVSSQQRNGGSDFGGRDVGGRDVGGNELESGGVEDREVAQQPVAGFNPLRSSRSR